MYRVGVPVVLVIWLIIGLIAAAQRGYLGDESDPDCDSLGTILVTIAAGPLNYVGVDPKINCAEAPEPSDN